MNSPVLRPPVDLYADCYVTCGYCGKEIDPHANFDKHLETCRWVIVMRNEPSHKALAPIRTVSEGGNG